MANVSRLRYHNKDPMGKNSKERYLPPPHKKKTSIPSVLPFGTRRKPPGKAQTERISTWSAWVWAERWWPDQNRYLLCICKFIYIWYPPIYIYDPGLASPPPTPPQCNVPILTSFPPSPLWMWIVAFCCGWEMWPLSLHCLIMIDVEWSGAHSVVEHGWVRPNDHHKSYMVSMEWLKVFPLIAWWNMGW